MTSLSTVCMMLGPYRNFTTLTASVLALHPDTIVFNHGGERVFSNPDLNFAELYSLAKFEAFSEFATQEAQAGEAGSYGGSIKLSASFNRNENIKAKYETLYPNGKVASPKCLVWKESYRLLYQLRRNDFDFEKFFSDTDIARFLIPVRNLYDCACSNFISGHFTIRYEGLKKDPNHIEGERLERRAKVNAPESKQKIFEILDLFLEDLKFLRGLQIRFPDRFLFYFQHETPEQIFTNVLSFLNLSVDTHDIHEAFRLRSTQYSLDSGSRARLLANISQVFPDDDWMRDQLSQSLGTL